jgi:rpsU-divergently transcribed protein
VAKLQQQLLDDALKHVKQLGWTRSSLAAAAEDLQLSPAAVGMFPRGASHLVEHFITQQNAELERELQASQQQYMALPLRQRITAAVRRRLEMNAGHVDSWPQVSPGGGTLALTPIPTPLIMLVA